MAVVEIFLLTLIPAYLFYKWATATFHFFQERGVYFEQPWPLVGNYYLNQKSFLKVLANFYNRNKTHKIVGFFSMREPFFMINDPECIKKIMVKDFDHFPNHMNFFKVKDEPLVEGMLSIMKDQRWKDMRNTLTPVFTAAKMRAMFTLMNECFEETLKYLRQQSSDETGFELELKNCFTKLSNDVIASTAFGLKVNSYEHPHNEFYKVGQTITAFKGKQAIKVTIMSVFPNLLARFNIKLFDAEKTNYFLHLVMDAMRYRQENNIVRPDMIQLLMEAKKESKQNWSNEEIVAQCFVFFFAAFENNANLICINCHALMENPDIQQGVYEEAVAVRESLNGAPLDYDAVGKLKYLDMVVSESLRKWPLAALTDRVCSKDYKLTDEEDNLVYDFKVGDRLWIPIVGLHWNEEYFENPDVFDPERFSDERKDSIKPFTYLPFGVGPRACIANRYALMQAKAILYYLVLNFKMERSPKTVKNLVDDMRSFQFGPKSGFWMRFVPRN